MPAREYRGLLGRIVGEISALRRRASTSSRLITGRFSSVYALDSSRVDYGLARALYDNADDRYKLGAWAARPVVNTCVGFMGIPRFRSEDEDAQTVLDDVFSEHASAMQQTHRDALRDGDAWVWITREETADARLFPETQGARLVYNLIPPEQIVHITRDALTGRPLEYVLASDHEWVEDGNRHRARVLQYVSAERRLIEVEGDGIPPGVEPGEERNPWGFLPIVQFSNERDSSSLNGRSDLEAIEPYMRVYHDVMLHALQGSKLHSTPRLKMTLSDVAGFLSNNFGVQDTASFVKEGGTINLDGKELLLFQEGEDAQFIEVRSATGSAEGLLKLLFFCIVDVSETPEFAFGVHTPSSHASVKEQMPVLVRRVSRKRAFFEDAWQHLARVVLAMTAQAENRRYATYATTILWDPIAERDEAQEATTLKTVVDALATAIDHALISYESAVDYLAQYVETMSDYVGDNPEQPGEGERIIRGRIRMSRLEDAAVAELESNLIDRVLREQEGEE